jgi:hypothetical protein
MNPSSPDIDVIRNNLRVRYRQKIKNEISDNGAYDLALVIIDVVLEITAEMLMQYDQALRESIGDKKPARGFIN